MSNLHQYIKNNFGQNCLSQVRDFEKTARKIANFRNHLRFSLRCLNSNVTPRSIKLKSGLSGHKANNILRNAERKLLNERIRQINFTIEVLNQKFGILKEKLTSGLPTNVFDRVSEFVRVAQLSQHNAMKNRHIEKFAKYKISRADKDTNWRKSSESVDAEIKQKWVKNYSDRDLHESARGLCTSQRTGIFRYS